MKFEWNEEKINFFLDAGAYGDFHEQLAKTLLPFIGAEDSFCDLGCGLGFVDMALAPHLAGITAVDAQPAVIESLRVRAKDAGFENLNALCADVGSFSGTFDVVFMSFFGCTVEELQKYAKMARKRLIRVVNVENRGNLYPEKYRRSKKNLAGDVQAELEEANLPYRVLCRSWEFGQPLRGERQALAYLRDLAPDAAEEELLAFLGERAQKTGRADFPLYLPNEKEIAIFIIETEGRQTA